jgi:hypothetical protein
MNNLEKFLEILKEDNHTNSQTTDKPFMRGAVINFLKKHPNPKDKDLHDWAEGMKFNIHRVEEIVYQLASEHVRKHM